MTNEVIILYGVGGALGIGLIWLMMKPRFWIFVFWVSALAALFTCIASVIHFQILAAVGFFLLSAIPFKIADVIHS